MRNGDGGRLDAQGRCFAPHRRDIDACENPVSDPSFGGDWWKMTWPRNGTHCGYWSAVSGKGVKAISILPYDHMRHTVRLPVLLWDYLRPPR